MLVLLLCLLFAQAALPTANFQRGLGSGGKGLKDIELTAQTPTEALRAARMARQINRGRRSIRLLRQATERWPDDPILLPALGGYCTLTGDLPCTATATEGEGLVPGQERTQTSIRADALARLGFPDAASALYAESLVLKTPERREAIVWLDLARSRADEGDLLGAHAAADMAEAIRPDLPYLRSTRAHLALLEADPGEAEFQLFLAERDGSQASDMVKAAALEVALQADDAAAVDVAAEIGLVNLVGQPEVAVWMAEALRRDGRPHAAEELLNLTHWSSEGAVRAPEILAALALARLDLGEPTAAAAALTRAVELAPGNRIVQQVVAQTARQLQPMPFGRAVDAPDRHVWLPLEARAATP